MPKMIQIRNVPDRVHSTLKSRAAREGMSLSDFIKRELTRTAERPSVEEWLDRLGRAKPVPLPKLSAQITRELRDTGNRPRRPWLFEFVNRPMADSTVCLTAQPRANRRFPM